AKNMQAAEDTGKGVPLPMPPQNTEKPEAPASFVLPAAAIVGFAFFLMEIVWYRMLSPILGGSVFTFGLILCLVLLGIGIGGLLYSMQSAGRPARLWGFAVTCLLEAAFVMVAYAMGDRLAWVANTLQAWAVFGFGGLATGWAVVAGIAVVPAAIVAGYQFPLLIALLGEGKTNIGNHVGAAYAWNTGGAIVGALAGGFMLLPMLGALGCWRMVGILLGVLGIWAIVMGLARGGSMRAAIAPTTVACAVAAMCFMPEGPTAAWRHSGVGVGRVSFNRTPSSNEFREWRQDQRQWVQKEMEGIESCIGIESRDGLAFVVNGKVDGNAIGDCGTQVMSGLLGAMLHGSPKSAAVVGLGGGSTAGWLGAVPTIERVDVVELEPAVLEYAKMCAAVNHGAMTNPKVHISIGDAREYLMTTPQRYDLVVSEPSNPYRAGIASLFTKEYYRSASARINDKGMFIQWVQSYNVDSRTVQTIYATLLSVFGHVETWNTAAGDMLLVASRQPIEHDIARLRGIVAQEPFRSAMAWTWGASGVEGLYAHYVVNQQFAKFFTDFPGIQLNTDDRTLIEFGFARAANMPTRFSMNELREAARAMGQHRPQTSNGAVDWDRVDEEMAESQIFDGSPGPMRQGNNEQMQRLLAVRKYMEGDLGSALAAWRSQSREPRGPIELAVVTNALAAAGDESAAKYIEQLREFLPVEADVVLGRLRIRQGKTEAGTQALIAAFTRFHDDPWAKRLAMRRGLTLVLAVGRSNPALAKRLGDVLRTPFAAYSQNETRQDVLVQLAGHAHDLPMMVEALGQYEPYAPWKGEYLASRANAYKAAGHKMAGRAAMELLEYRRAQGEAVLDDVMAATAGIEEKSKGTAMIEK
ncbi:MAG TPA: fused MFS/spermidine synthase, partial [Tepidisphaeraceae bacterium]|nr:fused MFS/spermidine synthase [Tepidisphaeraceae bacterium]